MYRRTFHGYYVQKYVHHKIGIQIPKKVRRFWFQQFKPSKSQKIRDHKSLGREFSRHPPDRENGKVTHEGFWTKSSHFLGRWKPCNSNNGHFHFAVDWSEKTDLLILIRRDGFFINQQFQGMDLFEWSAWLTGRIEQLLWKELVPHPYGKLILLHLEGRKISPDH